MSQNSVNQEQNAKDDAIIEMNSDVYGFLRHNGFSRKEILNIPEMKMIIDNLRCEQGLLQGLLNNDGVDYGHVYPRSAEIDNELESYSDCVKLIDHIEELMHPIERSRYGAK